MRFVVPVVVLVMAANLLVWSALNFVPDCVSAAAASSTCTSQPGLGLGLALAGVTLGTLGLRMLGGRRQGS